MIYFVSTPIWNLEDITLRALRVLNECDVIVCEDTRHSGHLLKHFTIKKPLQSFHSHSTREQSKKIIELALEKNIAFISDAGTPGISDPAYLLIQEAIIQDVRIEIIPWASALLTALIWSWHHMHDFRFLWFLPLKKWRQTLLRSLKEKEYTAVIYESPHRIEKTLSELNDIFWPEHIICIARELTKIHETYHRDKIVNLISDAKNWIFRGEMVLIF